MISCRILDSTTRSQSDSDEEQLPTDPNVARADRRSKKKPKEQLNFETKSIKSKWEQGEMDRAESERTDRSGELDELRGKSVKERFKERTGKEEPVDAGDRPISKVDIDTSCKLMPGVSRATCLSSSD
jgi:hypothetical protein